MIREKAQLPERNPAAIWYHLYIFLC